MELIMKWIIDNNYVIYPNLIREHEMKHFPFVKNKFSVVFCPSKIIDAATEPENIVYGNYK